MKFYKNWLFKSVKDYANLNVEFSTRDDSAVLSTDTAFSTPLKLSLVIVIYLAFLSLAAYWIVSTLDVQSKFRTLLLVLIYLKIGFDLFLLLSKSKADFTELRVVNHQWSAQTRARETQNMQLLRISKILGIGFVLKLQIKPSKKICYQIIWKHNSNNEFVRYCQQLIHFGSPNN